MPASWDRCRFRSGVTAVGIAEGGEGAEERRGVAGGGRTVFKGLLSGEAGYLPDACHCVSSRVNT